MEGRKGRPVRGEDGSRELYERGKGGGNHGE